MKIPKIAILIMVVASVSCATITRHNKSVERNTFLNIMPTMNSEIWGTAIEEAPGGNLLALHVAYYYDLTKYAELTADYKGILKFIRIYRPAQRLLFNKNTFIACFRFESHKFEVCDDASKPGADRVAADNEFPSFKEFVNKYLEELQKDSK